jgi:hypothetical protein
MSERYFFNFTLHDFDRAGEWHHFETSPTVVTPGTGLRYAVKDLVSFVARLLRIPADHLAAKRVFLRSAWVHTYLPGRGKKQTRITPKQVTEALLQAGFAPRGREGGHVHVTPHPYRFHKRKK